MQQAWSRLQFGRVQYIYDLCPTISLLECPPSIILHQAKSFQLQCCYGTQLFFLQVHEIGTNVCDPKIQNTTWCWFWPRRLGKIPVCESLTILPISRISGFIWWSSKQRVETLWSWSIIHILLSVILLTSVLVLTSFENNVFFSNAILFLTCAARWVHSRYTWSMSDTGSSKSTVNWIVAHIFGMLRVFPAIFMSSTQAVKNDCNLRWRYEHSHSETFFHPSSTRTFSNCLSHKRPPNGWP